MAGIPAIEPYPRLAPRELPANTATGEVDPDRAAGVSIAHTAQPGGMTDQQRGVRTDFWGPGMRPAPDAAVADFSLAYHRMALDHAAERCAVLAG